MRSDLLPNRSASAVHATTTETKTEKIGETAFQRLTGSSDSSSDFVFVHNSTIENKIKQQELKKGSDGESMQVEASIF